jgi:hypothetical protein
LCREVPFEQNCIEQLCKILYSNRGQYLTQLFNAVLLKGYFPAQWKVAQIILIPKPGNSPTQELTSYRPTSLLPIISKVLYKLLKRFLAMVEKINTKPSISLQTKALHSGTNT